MHGREARSGPFQSFNCVDKQQRICGVSPGPVYASSHILTQHLRGPWFQPPTPANRFTMGFLHKSRAQIPLKREIYLVNRQRVRERGQVAAHSPLCSAVLGQNRRIGAELKNDSGLAISLSRFLLRRRVARRSEKTWESQRAARFPGIRGNLGEVAPGIMCNFHAVILIRWLTD